MGTLYWTTFAILSCAWCGSVFALMQQVRLARKQRKRAFMRRMRRWTQA